VKTGNKHKARFGVEVSFDELEFRPLLGAIKDALGAELTTREIETVSNDLCDGYRRALGLQTLAQVVPLKLEISVAASVLGGVPVLCELTVDKNPKFSTAAAAMLDWKRRRYVAHVKPIVYRSIYDFCDGSSRMRFDSVQVSDLFAAIYEIGIEADLSGLSLKEFVTRNLCGEYREKRRAGIDGLPLLLNSGLKYRARSIEDEGGVLCGGEEIWIEIDRGESDNSHILNSVCPLIHKS